MYKYEVYNKYVRKHESSDTYYFFQQNAPVSIGMKHGASMEDIIIWESNSKFYCRIDGISSGGTRITSIGSISSYIPTPPTPPNHPIIDSIELAFTIAANGFYRYGLDPLLRRIEEKTMIEGFDSEAAEVVNYVPEFDSDFFSGVLSLNEQTNKLYVYNYAQMAMSMGVNTELFAEPQISSDRKHVWHIFKYTNAEGVSNFNVASKVSNSEEPPFFDRTESYGAFVDTNNVPIDIFMPEDVISYIDYTITRSVNDV